METILKAIAGTAIGEILGPWLNIIFGGILVYACGAGVLGLTPETSASREAPEVIAIVNWVGLLLGVVFLAIGFTSFTKRKS